MTKIEQWKAELKKAAKPEKIEILSRFFKTGKGEYGEGDIFIGLTVPENRKISVKKFKLNLDEIKEMLASKEHEFRLAALIALIMKYEKAKKEEGMKEEIVKFYLENTENINNWDLVDLSCPQIIGDYTRTHGTETIEKLSESKNLWEQRIAIVSTLKLIRNGEYRPTLKIAEKYLQHPHDLIHKASGWMLREIGKKDRETLREFLEKHAHEMPRTMLRYAIEKMDVKERKMWLDKGK
jgi:3-methyladenine DNA glycosylase AlkD